MNQKCLRAELERLSVASALRSLLHHPPAVELTMSAVLLFYTAIIAPIQICFWSYDDACNKFPTLYFDVYVDAFFVVRSGVHTGTEQSSAR